MVSFLSQKRLADWVLRHASNASPCPLLALCRQRYQLTHPHSSPTHLPAVPCVQDALDWTTPSARHLKQQHHGARAARMYV